MFYIQHTTVTVQELPKDCQEELIRNINTAWLKYGKKDCYYYNLFTQSFAFENKDCFIGMDLNLARKLLGNPTKEDAKSLVYDLDLDCKGTQAFKSVVFYFSNGKINDVHFGTNSIKDY
ncbi:MAG: hypothetical protein Kow0027_27760 [Saprospiraceae bacterium]